MFPEDARQGAWSWADADSPPLGVVLRLSGSILTLLAIAPNCSLTDKTVQRTVQRRALASRELASGFPLGASFVNFLVQLLFVAGTTAEQWGRVKSLGALDEPAP